MFRIKNCLESNTIAVETPYNERFVEALKDTIPPQDRTWNPLLKQWEIMDCYEDEVLGLIRAFFPYVKDEDISYE